jgi:hypothetical protein
MLCTQTRRPLGQNLALYCPQSTRQECHNKKRPTGIGTMTIDRVPLLGLKADQFRHPLDLEATLAFKQLPGWDWVVRSILGSVAEQALYLDNIGAGLLVGKQQLPNLHHLLVEACQILDMVPPQLYIRQNPTPNAYTLAIRGKQPFIVLHTSLIDLLTPEELQAVIAHELGHLKCDHGVYLTLANIMVLAAGQLPYWGGHCPKPSATAPQLGAVRRIYVRSRRTPRQPRSRRHDFCTNETHRRLPYAGLPTQC